MDNLMNPLKEERLGKSPRAPVYAYARVAHDLQGRIARGELQPGDRLPAFPDLCRQYGVSNITIRGALRHLVSTGLVETRPRSGVYVSAACTVPDKTLEKNLRGEQTIAFIATAVQNPFFADIIHGIEEECQDAGYRLIVANSNNEIARETQHLKELADQVAAMIIAPVTGDARQKEYTSLERLGVPFVFVDRSVKMASAPLVATDNELGAYQAMRHLIGIGRNEFLVVSGPHASSFDERLEGIRRALIESALPLDPTRILIAAHHDEAAAHVVLKNWLLANRSAENTTPMPRALFALSDIYARGCYVALREAGLQIPRDMAVVGFDDMSAVFLDPPMTAVRQDAVAMGAQAARVLFDLLRDSGLAVDPKSTRDVRLTPQLIVRNSTDAFSAFCPAQHLEKRGRSIEKGSPAVRATRRDRKVALVSEDRFDCHEASAG